MALAVLVAVGVMGMGEASALTYNASVADSMVLYCGSAYCCGMLGTGVGNWSCQACRKQPGLTEITVFDARGTNANGFVGYQPSEDLVVVAFSGTNPLSIENDLKDLTFWKTKYTTGGCHECKVHKGFLESWNSVQASVQNAVQVLLNQHPTARVAVTGHSLGAALAELCAMDLLFAVSSLPLLPVYSFGTPRVGDENYAQFVTATYQQFGSHSFKVVHWKDPVVHLPPEWDGFKFAPQQVFYNNAQSSYTVCSPSDGEDPSCSDQFGFNVLYLDDHLNYLVMDFTTNYLSCEL